MLNLLPSTKDYYDAWDFHMAEILTADHGYQAAVAMCIEKNWRDLELLLRAKFDEQNQPAKTGAP